MTGTSLVVRLDSDGDVLLSGPAVRAVSAGSGRLIMLCGPAGAAAAGLLPGVDEVLVWPCPWVLADPPRVDAEQIAEVVRLLRHRAPDRALVLTSFHQSPLPTALVLRLAAIPWVGATSEDYPGSLLDLRHRLPERGLHEVQRMLELAAAAGFPLPSGDDGRLRLRSWPGREEATTAPYVVVHPGASAPSRAPEAGWASDLVERLAAGGRRVRVTGGPAETGLTAAVAGSRGEDLGGRTTLAELAEVLRHADCVVVGNTGPAHLAASVGTPVVSLFAPVVPAERWRPWGVPHILLGDPTAPCAGTRAQTCPAPGHPCLNDIVISDVVAAVDLLAPVRMEAV